MMSVRLLFKALAKSTSTAIFEWNTEKVTTMYSMFYPLLRSTKTLGDWNTAKVTDMYGCLRAAFAFNKTLGVGTQRK